MNPFIEPTLARPLQGPAAQWQAGAAAPTQTSEASERGSPMSRFLRRRPRVSRGGAVRPRALGTGLKRGLCQALLFLGLSLTGAGASWAVDVNSASAESLQTVRGIGPKTAQAIVDERARGGAFESFDELSERVKGIGVKKSQSLQAAGLTLSTAVPAADKAAAAKPGHAQRR